MIKTVIGSLVLAVTLASAQAPAIGPVAPEAAPAPGAKPAFGKPTSIDFNLPLKPYKQTDLKFSMFAKRPAIVFYFSPTCGHCRHTYPHIQALQRQYEAKGLAFVAIAAGSATPEDIADFDSEFKLTMPAFRDQDKVFSSKYGTGSVPLILLVDTKGNYRLWNGSDDATLKNLDEAVKSALKGR
jgi:thiol-disulfide isomerase/thioredoxin